MTPIGEPDPAGQTPSGAESEGRQGEVRAAGSRFELHNAFAGKNGLQVGWRILIFLALLFAISAIFRGVGQMLSHRHTAGQIFTSFTASSVLVGEVTSFVVVLLASWIMSLIEGRSLGDYGLPARGAFRGRFWQGALIGFVAITALLVALRIAGGAHFEGLSLHGFAIWKYAAAWGLAFLFVGFFEEFGFRGYALFALTEGVGFWPAALALSFFFGYAHRSNPGESAIGAFSAGAVGLLFCLILRRTGDLWMPIGLHAAWDWGETYFYGVPDSGQVAHGHFLNMSFSGPVWLTGGAVGPEGSWFCLALVAILWIGFAVWLRRAKYPNPAAFAAGSEGDAHVAGRGQGIFPAG